MRFPLPDFGYAPEDRAMPIIERVLVTLAVLVVLTSLIAPGNAAAYHGTCTFRYSFAGGYSDHDNFGSAALIDYDNPPVPCYLSTV